MIGKASLAAVLLVASGPPAPAMTRIGTSPTGANANGPFSQIVHAPSYGGHRAPASFTMDMPGGPVVLLAGVPDVRTLDDWIARSTPNLFSGHPSIGMLGNDFDQSAPALPDQAAAVPSLVSAPVSEPAIWAMMIAGLVLAGVALRRRQSTDSFV